MQHFQFVALGSSEVKAKLDNLETVAVILREPAGVFFSNVVKEAIYSSYY
jgi:hypothetical protein